MSKLFSDVKLNKPKRNVFDLSHDRKFSMNMGKLIPFFCEEVIPGDSFNVSSEIFLRMAPMVAPIMHRVNVYTHFFFVPNRLVWDNWQKFITGGETYDPNNPVVPPVFPTLDFTSANQEKLNVGTLADYMGVQMAEDAPGIWTGETIKVNALPFRAYQLIFNEFYRDQNLQTPLTIYKSDGYTAAEMAVSTEIRYRNWEKDYFTSALPWTQKGGEVSLPLTGQIPVQLTDDFDGKEQMIVNSSGSGLTGSLSASSGALMENSNHAWLDPNESLQVDLEDANASITVNELRRSIRLQQWLERNARAGSRYIEQILSHFGVVSSDARLQRPEYLGGGKSPVVISEVLQNSQSDDTPQGNMAGHGISVGNTNSFKKFFEEHGYIIGIMSVMPRTGYQQGFRRHFLKDDKFDYFWPEFANLGEQEVYASELFCRSGQENDPYTGKNSVFGYQSRYSEYKFIPSTTHGDFRKLLSGYDKWHMQRIFDPGTEPALNETFVKANPTHRIFAVTDPSYDKLYVQVFNNVKAIRPMPKFGTPTF